MTPKTLAQNSGLDPEEVVLRLQDEAQAGSWAGLDIETGMAMDPEIDAVYDNYRVKRQILQSR